MVEKPQPGEVKSSGTAREPREVRQTDLAILGSLGDQALMTMEEVLRRENLLKALQRVKSNGGAPGVDGMTVEELGPHLVEHWESLREKLRAGTYVPSPVRLVEIPKANGKGTRRLGIPTVLDRLIQQALLQVLQTPFDRTFSESSFGFRPGRNTLQAVQRARGYAREGYRWVVNLDLDSFFDRVNHDILMSLLARSIEDGRILRLIRRYLQAGLLEDGVISPRFQGTPQGGPLSPLLSNVLLDVLDRELESRGHRFVRYADDCTIYVRTRRSGERVLSSLRCFLAKHLRLVVNESKSAVDQVWRQDLLGYSMTSHEEPKLRISRDSLLRFRAKLRVYFRRGRGRSVSQVLEELRPILRGWIQYYRAVEALTDLDDLDRWLRRRLRLLLWRHWKYPKTRHENLLRLGVSPRLARIGAWNGHGPWVNSGRRHMNIAVPNRWLAKQGLLDLRQEHHRLACRT